MLAMIVKNDWELHIVGRCYGAETWFQKSFKNSTHNIWIRGEHVSEYNFTS